MRLGRRATFAVAAVWMIMPLGPGAAAQSPDATASAIPAAMEACELHVWPSTGLRSVFHGWLHGGIVDGAVTGRDGYPEVPPEPLVTARQIALLETAGLDNLLGRPGYAVTIHPAPLTSVKIRQSRTRLIASQSNCYAELILEDAFFQEDFVNGGSLKMLIRFRDFGPGKGPMQQFGTWTRTPLKLFPPKEPSQYQAAVAELEAAFRANLAEFAAAREGGKKRK